MVPTGLRLPDQEEFQLFTSDHSFERYDLRFKELFGFERAVKRDIRDDDNEMTMKLDEFISHILELPFHNLFEDLFDDLIVLILSTSCT